MSPRPFTLNDPSLLHEASLLNGEWVAAQSNKWFDIEGEPTTLPVLIRYLLTRLSSLTDPGSRHVFATCPTNGPEDVDKYVETSHAAFERYRHVNPRERAKFLLKWHELIIKAREDIATIVVYETGKPMAEALGEVDYALGFAWWFAGEAERVRGSIALPSVSNRRTFVIKQPIGVSVALVPWNFPVAMIVRKVAAALAAGCTMIVKPSPETPLSVMALADLALRAGLAPGVLNVITTDNEYTPSVSERLCKHPLVRKVTFTGSTRVGSIIAKHCSERLKKVTMELGGNCPFIVFDDGDLEQAVAALMILKWRTAGQACTHANRVYVQAGVYDNFAQMMLEATQKLKVGHGTDSGTTMGPLTTDRGIEKLKKLVSDAISKGGKVLCGGKQPNGPQGYFFEPTIISDMTPEMLASREEIFGPLLGLHRFETEEEAVKMANDTSMGLASYFFTKNVDRTWRLLESLEAGMIGMNTGNFSCAESPFGGIKESGYGKEAGKDVAIEEYLISKTGTLTVDGAPGP
ncbi:Aldehyde/histidinol dehydrogenase [Aspergillus parasiticus]|uniref:succinate-semialdehyde dehydrogenase [NAD(P)(+)] n=1 Tax=Aspergillus parasiticus TaxID=5067 RepID=A0A5N6DSS4_ASPPA|nr:Aldehyde/histidinol dehydrogenase [Aspergillus parasiticus]